MSRSSSLSLHCYKLFATVVLLGIAAVAQDASTGVIRGTVVDPSGGRIRGATVAFVNAATGFRYAATTDAEGYAGVVTLGSGHPVNIMVSGDANQDGNNQNDRLPGARRNSFLGPDYATADLRVTRRLFARDRFKLGLLVESFNVLNRDNKQVAVTDQGLQSDTVQFLPSTQKIGFRYFPAQYRSPTNPLRITNAFAPRQVQFALKLGF